MTRIAALVCAAVLGAALPLGAQEDREAIRKTYDAVHRSFVGIEISLKKKTRLEKAELEEETLDAEAQRLYQLSDGGDATQYTASIVKVDILARWLRSYDKQGVTIPDDIPFSIKYLMNRMIQNSDNAAATSLFYFGGGCDASARSACRTAKTTLCAAAADGARRAMEQATRSARIVILSSILRVTRG